MLKLLLKSRTVSKMSAVQQVESLAVTEYMGGQCRKLIELGFLARFISMNCVVLPAAVEQHSKRKGCPCLLITQTSSVALDIEKRF